MEHIEWKKEFFFSGNETGCLLIHGFTSTPAEVRELGENLNKAGYTVLGVRLAGHGTVLEEMEKAAYTDWIKSVEDGYARLRERCSTIHVIGHSMGGVLALYIAENAKVNKVVALAPALVTKDPAAKYAGIAKYFMRYSEWAEGERPEEESKYLLGYRKIPVSSVHEMNKLQRITRKSLHKITQPVLILHALNDNAIHERGIDLIEKGVSSNEVKKLHLQNCGHNVTVEKEKDTVFQAVLDFLES
ncbi:alpha/beta fold hydrolase [Gorillibacterium sp. CAU 1737]|uniref:alpha/beta hydrolase n=1 Tax=Gorillibacterium sp. CAU 1737 TaxID=3140362 RepID=UPI003261825E